MRRTALLLLSFLLPFVVLTLFLAAWKALTKTVPAAVDSLWLRLAIVYFPIFASPVVGYWAIAIQYPKREKALLYGSLVYIPVMWLMLYAFTYRVLYGHW